MKCPFENKHKYIEKTKNKIEWNSCEIIPPNGIEIWVLLDHWKHHFPSSFQICAGEVEHGVDEWRVNTCDYDGAGCHCFYPEGPGSYEHDSVFSYWCHKWQIYIPENIIDFDWNCNMDDEK